MKKFMRKLKRLFIEDLEVRRSTSPLLIQTMAVGEAGASAKDDNGGKSSGETLAKNQDRAESEINVKDTVDGKVDYIGPPIHIIAPPPITAETAEDGKPPILIIAPEPKPYPQPLYAVERPPITIAETAGEGGKPPIFIIAPEDPGFVALYAVQPPTGGMTTLAVGEEGGGSTRPGYEDGKPPIFIIAPEEPPIAVKYAPPPIFIVAPHEPPITVKYAPPSVTTSAIGEEGTPPVVRPPRPTQMVGEDGRPTTSTRTTPIFIIGPGKKKPAGRKKGKKTSDILPI